MHMEKARVYERYLHSLALRLRVLAWDVLMVFMLFVTAITLKDSLDDFRRCSLFS